MKILENLQSRLKNEVIKTETNEEQVLEATQLSSQKFSNKTNDETTEMVRRFQSLRIGGGTYQQLYKRVNNQPQNSLDQKDTFTSIDQINKSASERKSFQQSGVILRNSIGVLKRAEKPSMVQKSEQHTSNFRKKKDLGNGNFVENLDQRKNIHSQSLAFLTNKGRNTPQLKLESDMSNIQGSVDQPKASKPSFLDQLLGKERSKNVKLGENALQS